MTPLWRVASGLGLLVVSANGQQNWAVIVAGSNGYWNYRHQADVCHAYHVVRRNGIPEERVILMSYGDAADSSDNPVRGTLFNKPTPAGVAGYDVSRGCKLSYSGDDVTADNFMAVLRGNNKTTEGKRVLQSTKDDRVFVYFADHGGVGLIAMPAGDPVYAQDLIDTLRYMWTNDMYKELVFYMEACESGSMFEGLLPTDANIFATTAANSHESSYGTYCGDESSVDGTVIGTCLGDLYSVNFLENSDIPGMFHTESLDSQFVIMRNETSKSHVQKFGSTGMGTDPIEWFQGAVGFPSLDIEYGERAAAVAVTPATKNGVDSRDIKLHTLNHQRRRATSARDLENIRGRISQELRARKRADMIFGNIFVGASGGAHVPPLTTTFTEHACLKASSTAVIASCGPWNDYSLKHVRALARLCEAGCTATTIANTAQRVCFHQEIM